MAAGGQLRLLLWKDYLIRKRNIVTLAGIFWTVLVMMCLYAVRINVDNQDFPSCQYPARALPSAGMVTFLQSFVCSVSNECSPMDQYEEIPTYENSKLTKLQRKLSPLLYNETVLEVAGSVPDALKMLSTVADIMDQPDLIQISKNGLKVRELFRNPDRVERLLISKLNVSEPVVDAILDSQLSLQGLFQGSINKCSEKSLSNLIQVKNEDYLSSFVRQLCNLSDRDTQKLALDLLMEINFSKYIKMVGNMYYKLSGDDRISTLADLVTAVLHMSRLDSYLPPAFTAMFEGRQVDFSYFNATFLSKLLEQFEPIFGNTRAYKILSDVTDAVIMGIDYLDKVFDAKFNQPVKYTGVMQNPVVNKNISPNKISRDFNEAIDTLQLASSNDTIDVFKLLSQMTNFIIKFLPENTKHDILFYSTLLSKLIEGANRVVFINWNIEEMAYDVSLKNPEGIRLLKSLPLSVVQKGYEALADAERIQILTSRLSVRGQIFCDSKKMANFFKVSISEADELKAKLCTETWKNYMGDLIKSFGIYDVRDLINNMASLVIQETIGKDTKDQLYTIERDFAILQNFTNDLIRTRSKDKISVDWSKIFNNDTDYQFLKVFNDRKYLENQILITLHGALAKEVVKQNSILEFKISPILIDLTTMVTAINDQLALTTPDLAEKMKRSYPSIVQTMLKTLKNETKTYRSLSTPSEDIVCRGVEVANSYLDLSSTENQEEFVSVLCNASLAIDAGLKEDSIIAKTIQAIKSSHHGPLESINWTKLITQLKKLYVKLNADHPYLFEFSTYGMEKEAIDNVDKELDEAKRFWFNLRNLDRGLHLSVKLVFRLLDFVDSGVFNMRNEVWLKMKLAFSSTLGPMEVFNDQVRLITAASQNSSYTSELPPTSMKAASNIIMNIPDLMIDASNILLKGEVDLSPIISLMNDDPPWPCSNGSLSDLLPFSTGSKYAVKDAEAVMCLDKEVQDEWLIFIKKKNLSYYNSTKWNTTNFDPHIFLKFSKTFDAVIEDTAIISEGIRYLMNETFDGKRSTAVDAWRQVMDKFNGTDKNEILLSLFTNIDTLLNSVTTPFYNESLNELWEAFAKCSNRTIEGECKSRWRAIWKYSLEAISLVVENMASDLILYFNEVRAPDSNILQMIGFTKSTGLHMLYDKFPEFIGALLNSFGDYGFMSQIRRASFTDFWDCDAVLESITPPPGSSIDDNILKKVKPFICPSLLYWLSLPRGANAFLDIVAKPQHIFYTTPVQQFKSNFKEAFIKTTNLTNLISNIKHDNATTVKLEDFNINTLKDKLKNTLDVVVNYELNDSNPSYKLFHEINRKQYITTIYLTKITSIANKLAVSIENINDDDLKTKNNEADINKFKADINALENIFKRRPNEGITFLFDVVTSVLFNNDDTFNLVQGIDDICNDLKNNDTNKDILTVDQRTKMQVCAKDYKVIYETVQNVIDTDLIDAKKSLIYVVDSLQDDNVTNIYDFFKNRKNIVNYLKSSIKYAYDLGLPIYLKYLQSNIQNYNVVLTFLAGEDWWKELRSLYNGPHVSTFFDGVEKGFEIAEDVLTKLDKIQLIRLLRDVNLNSTESFCQPNITLSDYIPDSTGFLSELKRAVCSDDSSEVFKEIPPLVFASQGFDSQLTLSKDIDYEKLNSDLKVTKSKLDLIKGGPKSPRRPIWVTDEKVGHLRKVAMGLLSKETFTKIAFGLIANIVDAGTLYLNTSQCSLCSQLTTWVKQINLQLYKKQEYDSLLCHLNAMSLHDIHFTLKNDFHWDMAFKELISFRNYTKYELNKSLNELLEQIKLHVLEDVSSTNSKLVDCIAKNVTANGFGNAAVLITVVADTLQLFQAELPHLSEVDGMKSVPFFQDLQNQVASNIDVFHPLTKYLNLKNNLTMELKALLEENIEEHIEDAEINLRLITLENIQNIDKSIRKNNLNWINICEKHDCNKILAVVKENLNNTLITEQRTLLQKEEFWKFNFVSRILFHVENLLRHVGRLSGVASNLDVQGVLGGNLTATVDFAMEIITDNMLGSTIYSIHGIIEEASPLLQNSSLEHDLQALTEGLKVLQEYKSYLQQQDIKLQISEVFPKAAFVEESLSNLGINNTNFWSVAAPRLQPATIHLSPILSWKSGDHISDYVCQLEPMSRVLFPVNLDVVTAEDVFGATIEQFCSLRNEQAEQIIPVLIGGLNYTLLIDKIGSVLLHKLYAASNLTEDEGAKLTSEFPKMAAVLPSIQGQVEEAATSLANEPLFKSFANFSSVGGLLGSSEFMENAGNMLCGKPFYADVSRIYKSVLQNKDLADQPDERQLEVLPTDFCRSLYSDIISMEGGKIVWSFIKPLVLGKVLYTPQSAVVEKIIRQANTTFDHMARITNLVHSFAEAFTSVDKLSEHRQGISVMRRLLSSPAFEELKVMLVGDGEVPDVDIDGLFDDIGDIQGIGKLLSKASSLLRCISLDRFRAVSDEENLTKNAAQLAMFNELTAGLVFLNSESQESFKNIEYKIRMDIDNVPTTARLKNYFWIPGPEDNFLENMRYFRGFIQLQDIVNTAIIKLAWNDSTSSREKRDVSVEDQSWSVYTQQMPYPCYRKDFFQTSLYESQALIVAFFFSMLFSVASIVRYIVADKETGNTMLMNVMGVNVSFCTLSWCLWSWVELTLGVIGATAVLKLGGILPAVSWTVPFVILIFSSLSTLSYCYMVSKLFSRASVAAVCAAIGYLVTFMPFVLILSLEAVISKTAKLLVCLSMSSSLCYAFLHITRLEAAGSAASWDTLWDSPTGYDDVSIGVAAVMLLVDAALYFVIGWTVERFFGLKSLQSSINHCDSSDEKAGVSVVNVSMMYCQGTKRERLALDNVSIELQKGQITTLLGHNGAGKTTLLKILTGMCRPTSGHVSVRGAAGVDAARAGVCPQHDVLFDHLSATEHVVLYTMLKTGKTLPEIQHEVDSTVRVLSLGGAGQRAARLLSGGTRRRLCVALAFVGDPPLVTLDEPTAGVDPAARRAIWSMILKLREERTILLTTHHMDEAELLSDQLIIMHKGQIHTIGNPIEVKRNFGNGYRLRVTFPLRSWDQETQFRADADQLMAAVTQVVKNAELLQAEDDVVEIQLPFYDDNGLHNDFLQLCTYLEANQASLDFMDYSMDGSTLQQVLGNICQRTDPEDNVPVQEDSPSNSASSCSIRTESAPLVASRGPRRGTAWQQYNALLKARYLHYIRNRWLLFILLGLPSLFICLAMCFSKIRPPADNEIALKLYPDMYGATEFLVPEPSHLSEDTDPAFARHVLRALKEGSEARNWTEEDTPSCECGETKQICDLTKNSNSKLPDMMLLPNVSTLNDWLLKSQEKYIEKRYCGYSWSSNSLVSWYNNKGHHSAPAALGAAHGALLAERLGLQANITTYSHPMKISEEQISKNTVYQHVADAGISGLVVLAYCLVSAGCAVYLVTARTSLTKRLQRLSGLPPIIHVAADLTADLVIILINMVTTAVLMEVFHFPVFVAGNNLPAICLLILLYGYACGNLMHLAEKLFSEASVANMLLFCGNAFIGLGGLTILLILDLISESERTDNARWVLHKIFMVAPQFTLGDGLLEISKNTIQAQVLSRFGMDTYKDPLSSDLVVYHYLYLMVVGTVLLAVNLAVESHIFDSLLDKFYPETIPDPPKRENEDADVAAERKRVHECITQDESPLRLNTIGNINAGFVDTEGKTSPAKRVISSSQDVAACVNLSKVYQNKGLEPTLALQDFTLGFPQGQCTVLLGENGAGKSTIFGMLAGRLRPSAGHVRLLGTRVTRRHIAKGHVSYCPQSNAIDAFLTVRETLEMYCQLRGIDNEAEVIKRTVEMFELNKYIETRAGALSGGNKRKLCTAIAFMSRSSLILLDEPTSGMDPSSCACVWRGVRAALRSRRAVLVSTHTPPPPRTRPARLAARTLAAVHTRHRISGGYSVSCRARGVWRGAWRGVRSAGGGAVLRAAHAHMLHFTAHAHCDEKGGAPRVSDIFRLMAELQSTSDVEDFMFNESSLEQEFFDVNENEEPEPEDEYDSEQLCSITSL